MSCASWLIWNTFCFVKKCLNIIVYKSYIGHNGVEWSAGSKKIAVRQQTRLYKNIGKYFLYPLLVE